MRATRAVVRIILNHQNMEPPPDAAEAQTHTDNPFGQSAPRRKTGPAPGSMSFKIKPEDKTLNPLRFTWSGAARSHGGETNRSPPSIMPMKSRLGNGLHQNACAPAIT